nr:E-beta-farnesene synthase [Tanacetum cinerariifolium]
RKHRFHPRPDSSLHLSNEESVLGYLKFSAKGTKREIFGMPIPSKLITANIREAPYYQEYQENPAPTSVLAKTQENKCKQATGTTNKPAKAKRIKSSASCKTHQPRSSPKSVGESEAKEVPAEGLQVADEDADFQKAVEESMKDAYALPKGPLLPVVIREPLSQKCQERARLKCLRSRRVSEPTASSFYDESPYEVLGQSDSKEESKKIMLRVEKGSQDEGQARPDPNAQAEGQARSNPDETSEGQAGSNPDETSEGQARPDPGNAEARVQSTSNPVVHAGSDREHMDLDVANVSPQPSTEQLYEGFTATVYPNVQDNLKLVVEEPMLLEEPASSSGTLSSLQHLSRDFSFGDQFFSDKPLDADKSTKTKVESMVNVSIQQALSSISLMTSPIIDLTSRPESPKEHQQLKATTTNTTTTTTTTLPLPLGVHLFWIEEECKYDIAAMYGISHWWFQRQRFYIDRHMSEGDRRTVRTHMRILSVVRIEVFSMYGYDYMKNIVLCRADLNEHVIAERNFKYLYPSDFKDLNLLNLQGHLNHLPPKDKKILTTAVNQWTRQLVIRQRVEDFQLGIESYQTQVNLTKPQWTATGFEYKHDYTVIESPRAVIFQDKYEVQMMMHFNEIHKFSDGTLQQIVEALDYRVKEFRINRMNPGLNTRFWTRKDVDRCNAFMFAIQRRLRTRRIFRNLQSFVGGRVREGDYRLLKLGFNSLVHSLCAMSALRRSGLRTASTAAKPCQGDSLEFYLITGSIHTDQRETVVRATLFNGSACLLPVGVVRWSGYDHLIMHKLINPAYDDLNRSCWINRHMEMMLKCMPWLNDARSFLMCGRWSLLFNGAATLMMSLGSIYMEVSCEGYLEDATEINCMKNAYYECLRVNTYFVLAIDESFSRADVAILMA